MVKMKYKRFNAILDIKLDEETYNKVESWQEETKPVDYIKSIIKDHAQDRGLLIQIDCLLYTSPSPRDRTRSRMPSSA